MDEASLAARHFIAASAAVDCPTFAPYALDTSPDCTCSVRAPVPSVDVIAEIVSRPAVRAVRTVKDGELSYLVPVGCVKDRQGGEEERGTGADAGTG